MSNDNSSVNHIESYKAALLIELEEELRQLVREQTISTCVACEEETQCVKYCCQSPICVECFPKSFIYRDYRIVCPDCNKTLSPENVFTTPQFLEYLAQFHRTMDLIRHIDFQICTCGAHQLNETMFAKQHCDSCQRYFCFFCNKDWNEENMRNEKYTCKMNCTWETKITYQLLDFAYDSQMQIPSHRCCPKCLRCGAYDQKCKYHWCDCGYRFCFICLKSEEDCGRDYQSAYNEPCGAIATQSFTIFPRLPRQK